MTIDHRAPTGTVLPGEAGRALDVLGRVLRDSTRSCAGCRNRPRGPRRSGRPRAAHDRARAARTRFMDARAAASTTS
ncbi:hypothetical protein, partial [Actinomadura sp. CNU-125]|uniref:hypothetical protein n=1 Tax=Actinomadura sp. CNU-125 TaxID=1904961 RepID=UPI001177CEF2